MSAINFAKADKLFFRYLALQKVITQRHTDTTNGQPPLDGWPLIGLNMLSFSCGLIFLPAFVLCRFNVTMWMDEMLATTSTAARRRSVLLELSCYRSSMMTTTCWIYVLTTGDPTASCHQPAERMVDDTVHGQGRRMVVITRQSAKDREPDRSGRGGTGNRRNAEKT